MEAAIAALEDRNNTADTLEALAALSRLPTDPADIAMRWSSQVTVMPRLKDLSGGAALDPKITTMIVIKPALSSESETFKAANEELPPIADALSQEMLLAEATAGDTGVSWSREARRQRGRQGSVGMSETTKLRELRIVGPRPGADRPSLDWEKFTWHADLSVAYLGQIVPSRKTPRWSIIPMVLRVLLQAPEFDAKPTPIKINVKATPRFATEPAIKETAQLRTPHLLIGNVYPRGSTLTFVDLTNGYALRAAVPEADPEKGKTTRGFSSLVLTQLDPWPTPQTDRQIDVPRFAIVERAAAARPDRRHHRRSRSASCASQNYEHDSSRVRRDGQHDRSGQAAAREAAAHHHRGEERRSVHRRRSDARRHRVARNRHQSAQVVRRHREGPR